MINFSELPIENPFALPKPGVYKARITEAAMKEKQDGSGEYLNMKFALTDAYGVSAGTIYDIVSESTSDVVKYKLGRLIRACALPLTGAMELKDLGKVITNRDIVVDVKIDKDNKGNDKAVVDLFSREAYYLPEEFDEIYTLLHPDENAPKGPMNEPTGTADEELPFNAPDGGAPANASSPANY
jgi:hypothetical protein